MTIHIPALPRAVAGPLRSGQHLIGRTARLRLGAVGALPVVSDLTALGSRIALGVALLHGPTARRITGQPAGGSARHC